MEHLLIPLKWLVLSHMHVYFNELSTQRGHVDAGRHGDAGQSKSLARGDVLHGRRLLTASLSVDNYQRPIVSVVKLVLCPALPFPR